MSLRYGLVVLGISALASPVMGEITWTLELIADGMTAMPGGIQNFQYFSEPAIEGSSIAFVGSDGLARSGIYRFNGENLERVADTTTVVPGRVETFGEFFLPSFAGSDVIFMGRSSNSDGVYRWRNGTLDTVVDETTTLPGVSQPRSFGNTAARGSSLIIETYGFQSQALHRIEPGPVELIALQGSAAPGGGLFGGMRRISTDGVNVAFINEAGPSGWVLLQGEPGNLSVIAEPGTQLPNGQLEDFDRLVLQGQRNGRVIFVAKPVGLPESAYVWDAGQISLAFEGTDSPSGGAPFDDFHFVGLADGAEVVIGRAGLHIKSGDQQVQVFNWSTMFQGKRLAGAVFGPAGVTSRAIALKVYFDDHTEGIMRVNFAITPTSSGGGGGGGAMDIASLGLLVMLSLAGGSRQMIRRTSRRAPL